MSGFTKNFKFRTTFDGDDIRFTLQRLKRKDVIRLAPLLDKVKDNITDDEAIELANSTIDIIKPYIIKMEGLEDETGQPITIADMLEEQYFFRLSNLLISELFDKSSPTESEEEEKKSSDSLPTSMIVEESDKT